MRRTWLTSWLIGFLSSTSLLAAADPSITPLEGILLPVSATAPFASSNGIDGPPLRLPDNVPSRDLPQDLPDTLPPLIAPPATKPSTEIIPTDRTPIRSTARLPGGLGDYNPSYSYLPDYIPPSPRRSIPCACETTSRLWLDFSYFYGTTKPEDLPGLIGTGSIVHQTGIISHFVGQDIGSNPFRSGFQFHGGMWLNKCATIGVEGSLLLMETDTTDATFSSDGRTPLRLPYVDPKNNQWNNLLWAGEGRFAGVLTQQREIDLIGAEANYRQNFLCGTPFRIDGIAGYRYLRVSESLTLMGQRTSLMDDVGMPAGSEASFMDRFTTRNNFHGGQIGVNGIYQWRAFTIDLTGKVAFGVNHDTLSISGERNLIPAGGPLSQTPGGVYSSAGALGSSNGIDFAVLPEVNCKFGYKVRDNLNAYLGYNFLYINNIKRPGAQVELASTPTAINDFSSTFDPRGNHRDVTSDFWLQGITLGMELRY